MVLNNQKYRKVARLAKELQAAVKQAMAEECQDTYVKRFPVETTLVDTKEGVEVSADFVSEDIPF